MKFIIKGGKTLEGEIIVAGSKNAATPIIAATLLTDRECVLENVPQITDVERMLQILLSLGGQVWRNGSTVKIVNKNINPQSLDKNMVAAMRSSVLFLGPLLARVGEATIPEPGGCIIGNRPIDTHLEALTELGAEVLRHQQGFYQIKAGLWRGGEVILREFSVTATENLMMAAAVEEGETIIKMAAAEPHVEDLAKFLRAMGADIAGDGTHTIRVKGQKKLSGARHAIIPDPIEAGTFAALAAVTKSNLAIKNMSTRTLESILHLFRRIGVNFHLGKDFLEIRGSRPLKSFKFQALPHPGLPTDLQAPFGVLATQCVGTSLIHDPLYEGRMGYVGELVKMGANAIVCDPHRVLISGPTPLYGTEIKSLDLRAGATLLIAGLVAQGETIINDAEVLDRGYERIDERLRKLGADIKRISN